MHLGRARACLLFRPSFYLFWVFCRVDGTCGDIVVKLSCDDVDLLPSSYKTYSIIQIHGHIVQSINQSIIITLACQTSTREPDPRKRYEHFSIPHPPSPLPMPRQVHWFPCLPIISNFSTGRTLRNGMGRSNACNRVICCSYPGMGFLGTVGVVDLGPHS
jgi:hypothetical protein